ncbi:hypothetical protein FLAVO9AF_120020 [Flavobacterium sp. 9AF]|nr:hypothetical protein FLAVO9AF_120020 [Flavobacterium sp. 9AF]
MQNTEIEGKIQVLQKEISVTTDPVKKSILQKELQILNFRKQIDFCKNKIKQIRNSM